MDIRVAIIGYGLAGRVFHAPLVAATPDMAVAAIVTGDPGRAAQARADHPGAQVVAAADELWASPGEIDLVVIAAPNRAHVPLARAAIAAGLAVVIDKPMAPDADQGAELVREADAAGVLLSVFQNRRWDGDFLTVRRLLAEGAVGRVVRLESRFDRWRPAVAADAWRERPEAQDAGGLLADLGSHLIDQAIVLFGPPVRVHAEIARAREGAQVDDDVFVSLTHAGGELSHLAASMLAPSPRPRFRLTGTAGTYESFGLDPQEDALRDGGRPGEPGWGSVPPERWGRLYDGDSAGQVPTAPGDYPAFYAGVGHALREGGPPPVAAPEAVRVLRVIDAARLSDRRGGPVTLPDPGA